jgi:uncharacterized protein YggE
MRKNFVFILVSLALAIVLGACAAAPAATSPQTPAHTLAVAGQGKVTIVPDIAYVNIGVHSEADNVAEALRSNTSQAQNIAQALQSMGVGAEDIQTSNFNIYPQQQFGPNGEQLGIKYMVDNTVYVTVRDLSKLGDLLDKVVSSGANNINGISFDASDKEKSIAQARQLAIDDAKSQAVELAKAAGVTLGEIQNLNVFSNNGPISMFDAKGGAAGVSAGSVPVSAGQMIVTADASITYEIK